MSVPSYVFELVYVIPRLSLAGSRHWGYCDQIDLQYLETRRLKVFPKRMKPLDLRKSLVYQLTGV